MTEQDQQKIVKVFKETMKDENKRELLIKFLDLIQNDELQTNLDKFDDIQQNVENIEAEHEEIKEILESLKETQNNFSNKFKQISQFYDKVFAEKKDENGKITHIPLDKFIDNQKERLQKLYDDKNKILTSLYDPTTAEGLSKAYADEKKDIQKSVSFWNWVFSIAILVFLSAFGVYFYLSFQQAFTYVAFLRALPFWIFSGFFIFYSTKQIAEYKRMASEYAHKETLSKTYIGYKKQVDEADNEELNNKLLEIILKSARFNPSKILDGKGEIPSTSLLQQIKEILSNKKTSVNTDEKKVNGEA